MGKYAIIIISCFVFAFASVKAQFERINTNQLEVFVGKYEQSEAKTIAYSLVNMALVALSYNAQWRTGYTSVSMGGGMGWTMVQDNREDASLVPHQVRVIAAAANGGTGYMVEVKAFLPFHPDGVRASITANSDVTVKGTLFIDGRDHDWDGNLRVSSGTWGISTGGIFEQGGAAMVGGTASGADYIPSRPADPPIIQEYATGTPATPDEVFGFAEGTLKAVALRGRYGSQYVTSPDSLIFPLSGVTYVELADGEVWEDIDFGESSAVLVVHNESGSAKIRSINYGTFKGLIIADDIEHIHATILGGVVSLTASPSGNCIGNGSGAVLFSREAILRASSSAVGGNGGVTVTSWDGSTIATSGQHGTIALD